MRPSGGIVLPRLVVGLGNPLAGDDGVGWRLADLLANDVRLPPDVEVLCGGDDVLRFAPRLMGRREVLFIDARLGGRVGAVEFLDHEALRQRVDTRSHAHHISAVDAVDLLIGTSNDLYGTVIRWALVGVSGVQHGGALSAELGWRMAGALEEVLEVVRATWPVLTPAER